MSSEITHIQEAQTELEKIKGEFDDVSEPTEVTSKEEE